MDTVPAYSEKTRSGFRWRAEQIRSSGKVSAIFDIVMPRSFGSETKSLRPHVINKFQAMLAAQSTQVYTHLCELAATVDAWSAFNSLNQPALFVSGSEDVSTSLEIMRPLALQHGARLIEIPNAGHNPPLEQPAFVAKVLFTESLA